MVQNDDHQLLTARRVVAFGNVTVSTINETRTQIMQIIMEIKFGARRRRRRRRHKQFNKTQIDGNLHASQHLADRYLEFLTTEQFSAPLQLPIQNVFFVCL